MFSLNAFLLTRIVFDIIDIFAGWHLDEKEKLVYLVQIYLKRLTPQIKFNVLFLEHVY